MYQFFGSNNPVCRFHVVPRLFIRVSQSAAVFNDEQIRDPILEKQVERLGRFGQKTGGQVY